MQVDKNLMLSTRFVHSPWCYYQWTEGEYAQARELLSHQNVRGKYYGFWHGKQDLYYHHKFSGAWSYAGLTAATFAMDYGYDNHGLLKRDRDGKFKPGRPALWLRDC